MEEVELSLEPGEVRATVFTVMDVLSLQMVAQSKQCGSAKVAGGWLPWLTSIVEETLSKFYMDHQGSRFPWNQKQTNKQIFSKGA